MIENKAHLRRFLVFVSRTSRIKLNITHRPLILEVTRIVYLIDLFVVASSSDNHHFIRSATPVRSLFRSNLQIITRIARSANPTNNPGPATFFHLRSAILVEYLEKMRKLRDYWRPKSTCTPASSSRASQACQSSNAVRPRGECLLTRSENREKRRKIKIEILKYAEI